jgi:hypothetical protein
LEAREKLEAKWSQALSDPHLKKQVLFSHLPGGKGKVDGRVANIEDIYLREDGSIQCVVTWKPSLVEEVWPPGVAATSRDQATDQEEVKTLISSRPRLGKMTGLSCWNGLDSLTASVITE